MNEIIPKIIHQTAKTKHLSWEERILTNRAKKIMPDYEFRLYDDNDNLNLMKRYFPEYVETYNRINKGVAKADIARLVYMYAFGGWYCDTDYKWITPPHLYLINKQEVHCILPISREGTEGFRLGNAVFGSVPGHPFWKGFIDHIFSSEELTALTENRIEKVTGPEGLTEYYLAYKENFGFMLFPNKKYFHPKLKGLSAIVEDGNIGIHLCWGSWRTGRTLTNLKNLLKRKLSAII